MLLGVIIGTDIDDDILALILCCFLLIVKPIYLLFCITLVIFQLLSHIVFYILVLTVDVRPTVLTPLIDMMLGLRCHWCYILLFCLILTLSIVPTNRQWFCLKNVQLLSDRITFIFVIILTLLAEQVDADGLSFDMYSLRPIHLSLSVDFDIGNLWTLHDDVPLYYTDRNNQAQYFDKGFICGCVWHVADESIRKYIIVLFYNRTSHILNL